MSRAVGLLAMVAALACSSKSEVKSHGSQGGDGAPAARPSFTLFALAELRGQVGPCGCTSDPLGDIARTAQLIAETRAAGPAIVVDAGSLLYSKVPIPAQLAAQEELKAELIGKLYRDELRVDAVGLGPADLGHGLAGDLRLARHAANLDPRAGAKLEPPEVIEAGGAKVGVFAVIAPDAIAGEVTDPVAAGKAAVAELTRRGAQVVVGLIQAASKRDAVKLVRDIGGIDFAVAGLGSEAPEPDQIDGEAQKVGDGWLVVPANRGQVVSRIEVTLRGGRPFADAIGKPAAAARIAALDRELAALDRDLARFAADPAADPAFVATKRRERTQAAALREQLTARPLVAPATGSYFTLEQVRINKRLACAPRVQDAVTELYRAASEANVKAAAAVPIPAPAKGKPGYAGDEACGDCHQDAAEFWARTSHARAWQTLVDRRQQLDLDCVGCHVTGYDRPGGSSLAHNEKLRNVQCETCHGPASIHVAKLGEERPLAVTLAPPAELCATQCHTKEHSDTFQYEAYLRDVVGPGHGEQLRKRLGDGPTGAQLRKAALDKAGRTLGAGCVR